MPQANSTTSMPRWMEPSASLSTFPCSSVINAAISARSLSISSFRRNITRARLRTGVFDQPGNAFAAAAIAASTSDSSDIATSAHCFPVAELKTLAERPEALCLRSPSIQFGTRRMSLIAVAFSAIGFFPFGNVKLCGAQRAADTLDNLLDLRLVDDQGRRKREDVAGGSDDDAVVET